MYNMTEQIILAIENRQESMAGFLRDALSMPVSRENLSFVLLPIVNKLKNENHICGKAAEIINDSLSEYSMGITNIEDTTREFNNKIAAHYERILGEILFDMSTIRTESDVSREKRKVDNKVKYGYLDRDIATFIKSLMDDTSRKSK